MALANSPKFNHLLAALPPEVQERIFPHLELVKLPLRKVLYESGDPMGHVYFPADAIISMQYVMESCTQSPCFCKIPRHWLMIQLLPSSSELSPSYHLQQLYRRP